MPSPLVAALVLSLASEAAPMPTGFALGVPPLRLAAAAPVAPDLDFKPEAEPVQVEATYTKRSSFGVRVLTESAGMAALGVGGALAGAATGALLCNVGRNSRDLNESDGMPCLGEVVIGSVVGAWVGGSAGTALGGHATGADGNFFAALGGSLLTGLAGAYLTGDPALLVPFAALGNILFYELTVSPEPHTPWNG